LDFPTYGTKYPIEVLYDKDPLGSLGLMSPRS